MRHERITGVSHTAVFKDDLYAVGSIMSEDVYALPEGDREQFSDDVNRDNFQACGVDDYAPVDKVISANGDRFFATVL